jgi:uncharacterized protein
MNPFRIERHGQEISMTRTITVVWIASVFASLMLNTGPSSLRAEDVFITIGGGDLSGVYFPAGLAIAKMLNHKRHEYGIRATVEATAGATFNLNAIIAGYLEFGLTQSDKQYQAVNGLAEWTEKGPQSELRAVFSLHHETVTLVAAVDAGLRIIADLKGKRVSTGNPGSSQHRIVIDALKAFGLEPSRDISLLNVMASEAPALLQDNRIDAYFFTVGHPSETIRKARSGERQVRIIPISGPAIDQLVAKNIPYVRATIPVKQLYPDAVDQADVATFGVIATLCTSSRVSADVVYAVTKEIFENLELFRRQHPAFNQLTKAGMLEGLSAPLHPGALRYFQETGLIK